MLGCEWPSCSGRAERHKMKKISVICIILGVVLPGTVIGGAFEQHTGWQKEPLLETEKGITLGKSVIEMITGVRYLDSTSFFNSHGKIDDAPMDFSVITWDLIVRFGFTGNWTFSAHIPVIWSEEEDALRVRSTEGEIGDSEVGVLYQFFRQNDPTLSMGVSLLWKLPTGGEAPGTRNVNITGTGTTDVELAYLGRWQVLSNLSVGWATGYNIRFPGPVQYLSDRHSYVTNAFLDLGDELFLRAEGTLAIDMFALKVIGEFRYRFSTEVGMPEYRVEELSWINPKSLEPETEEYLLYNGASYQEWDVPKDLVPFPSEDMVSSAGYLISITPQLIIRPLEWLDITLTAKLHLLGRNTIYLTNKDGDNATFDNFMPMQTLGRSIGFAVLGEVGGYTTVRW